MIAPEVVTTFFTASILGLISMALRKSRPLELNGQNGAIAPDVTTAWFTIVVGIGMSSLGIFLACQTGNMGSLVLTALGLVTAGFMLPSVTKIHVVRWTADFIQGPSKMFGPTLGKKRTEIAWGDIQKMGKTLTGYWFVEARDGRRIYWSYLYRGYGNLHQELARRCPNLHILSK